MPLSEREQKILEEIEKGLYTEDPRFARDGSSDRGSKDLGARARTGALTFLAGFLLLIAFFVTRLILVGLLGFAGMVTGIVLLASPVSALMSNSKDAAERRGQSFKRSVSDIEDRLRRRYRRR